MKVKMKLNNYIMLFIIYLEVLFKILVTKDFNLINICYTILCSIPFILGMNVICHIFKEKVSKTIFTICAIILTVYFLVQLIFFKLFSVPFSFSTIGLAGGALGFTDVLFETIFKNTIYILIYFLPVIAFIIFRKKIKFGRYGINRISKNLLLIIFTFLAFIVIINIDNKGTLTSTRIDIQRTISGFEDSLIMDTSAEIVEEQEVTYNTLDIDFEALKNSTTDKNLMNVYNYIENREPTNKNKYTGYFENKNLIFILAEGFNSIAVNQELTPTLYKLTTSGFIFKNFYSPVFLSTTGGEFQATTGLIPTQTTLSMWKSNAPYIKFGLGNSFSQIGYNAKAYHNWTYNYYDRNKTMPTLGFSSYMGLGNGLEKMIKYKWLPSDIDLIESTTDFYIGEQPFVVYYITVSGHAPYVISMGNSIAYKNRELVKDLEYPTAVKAYIATQIELDKALELLLNKLNDAGVLDNTVIALVGDHYPYTLSVSDINKISSYERDEIVEVNRSNFILWNNQMEETIEVEKVGSQIDVLPTLLNLFNIEYDSRMIIGQDILSDNPGLAVFSNRSWVTDKGTYFAGTKKFVPKEETEVEEGYVDKISAEVANKFTMSNLFIKYNIYKKIFE